MAGSLIETLSGEFDPSQYKDTYREALQSVIEAKVEGREVVQPSEAQPSAGTVVDLMAALRASVEAAKQGRPAAADAGKPDEESGPATTSSGKPAGKSPAKSPGKASGKKAAGKPAAKKAAADKPPARAEKKTARRSA